MNYEDRVPVIKKWLGGKAYNFQKLLPRQRKNHATLKKAYLKH